MSVLECPEVLEKQILLVQPWLGFNKEKFEILPVSQHKLCVITVVKREDGEFVWL